jgi:HPt (histidine-containing phosphotransfer) domain-containing protein
LVTVEQIDTSAVDTATIMVLQEDGALLRELTDLFACEAPEQLHKMLEGNHQGDTKKVAEAAHRLKGSAVTFGAGQMQRMCIEIEGRARGGSLNGVEPKIRELSAEVERVKAALDRAIAHPG